MNNRYCVLERSESEQTPTAEIQSDIFATGNQVEKINL